jgi:hypothetical protein
VIFKRLVVCIALLSAFTMAARVSADAGTGWQLGAGCWTLKAGDKSMKEARKGALN